MTKQVPSTLKAVENFDDVLRFGFRSFIVSSVLFWNLSDPMRNDLTVAFFPFPFSDSKLSYIFLPDMLPNSFFCGMLTIFLVCWPYFWYVDHISSMFMFNEHCSCNTISYHVIPCYTMLYHVIPCYIMLYHVLPCHAMLYHVIPCYTMLYHVIPCYTMSYHVISCHTMSPNPFNWSPKLGDPMNKIILRTFLAQFGLVL